MLVPNPGFPLVPQAQNLDFNLKNYELIVFSRSNS